MADTKASFTFRFNREFVFTLPRFLAGEGLQGCRFEAAAAVMAYLLGGQILALAKVGLNCSLSSV